MKIQYKYLPSQTCCLKKVTESGVSVNLFMLVFIGKLSLRAVR